MNHIVFGQAATGNPLTAFVPLILIFFVFYFLLILPQQKKQKQVKQMLAELKAGDKIVTVGGAVGEVEKIKDNLVTIKFAENVSIDYVRSAIAQVIKNKAEAK